jgi:hypothetical protein
MLMTEYAPLTALQQHHIALRQHHTVLRLSIRWAITLKFSGGEFSNAMPENVKFFGTIGLSLYGPLTASHSTGTASHSAITASHSITQHHTASHSIAQNHKASSHRRYVLACALYCLNIYKRNKGDADTAAEKKLR